MIIPPEQLSGEALESLVEEYCLREHGCNESEEPLGERKRRVYRGVESGEIRILYTPNNPNQPATLVDGRQLEN